MKSLKKALAVMLAALMILTSVSVLSAFAEDGAVTPVIVVGGYSSSDLYLDYGTENEEHVWGLNKDAVLSQLEKNFGKNLTGITKADKTLLSKVLCEVVVDVAGVLACNPDGTSKYNVTAGLTDPAISSTKYLKENYSENESKGLIQLPRINDYFCDEVGAENVFNCHVDFRMGAVKCAKALDEYVQAVKDYTGAEKVSLFGLSHGGMTIGVFLSLVANYPDMVSSTLDDIDNAVLFHPALAGADFLTPFMMRDVNLDAEQISEYAEVGALSEYEFEIIVHLLKLGFLDDVINKLTIKIWPEILQYWGSVWDFADPDYYEDWKAEYLDPDESAQLIEESDFMHYEIMPNYSDAFKKVQDAGIDINIIAGYGRTGVLGKYRNSDSILAVASTTGAKAAPIGKRFADGYTQSGGNCSDPTHIHVSPAMDIDASYAYLPENTFYVYRQFHGQAWFDDSTMDLCQILLFTDDIKDVYSDPLYEQFEYSRTKKDDVTIDFDGSGKTGFLAQDASGVNVTNLSSYPIVLGSIYCRGMDLFFNTPIAKKIAPGETVYVTFSGEITDVNAVRDTLIVNYTQLGPTSVVGTKSFPFMIIGGQEIEYNEDEPFADFNLADPADAFLNGTKLGKISERIGFRSILSVIYNTIMKYFGDLIKFIGAVSK